MVQRKVIHYLGFTFKKLGKSLVISLNAPLSIIPDVTDFVLKAKSGLDWIVFEWAYILLIPLNLRSWASSKSRWKRSSNLLRVGPAWSFCSKTVVPYSSTRIYITLINRKGLSSNIIMRSNEKRRKSSGRAPLKRRQIVPNVVERQMESCALTQAFNWTLLFSSFFFLFCSSLYYCHWTKLE